MIKHGVPEGSMLGPLLSFICVSDLPSTVGALSEPIIFADDTSVIISSEKFDDFHTMSNIVLIQMGKWFSAKKLALNLDKTNIVIFMTKCLPQHTFKY
jgi:hypothetical protein